MVGAMAGSASRHPHRRDQRHCLSSMSTGTALSDGFKTLKTLDGIDPTADRDGADPGQWLAHLLRYPGRSEVRHRSAPGIDFLAEGRMAIAPAASVTARHISTSTATTSPPWRHCRDRSSRS